MAEMSLWNSVSFSLGGVGVLIITRQTLVMWFKFVVSKKLKIVKGFIHGRKPV